MPLTDCAADVSLAAAELAHALERYLAEHPGAALIEDGRVIFEMSRASYSLSTDHGRCVLQVWSEERNMVRTVAGLAARKETLNVVVRRFGRSEPQTLQFVPDRDTRTPTTRSTMRSRFFAVTGSVARAGMERMEAVEHALRDGP